VLQWGVWLGFQWWDMSELFSVALLNCTVTAIQHCECAECSARAVFVMACNVSLL
jgi:hypothetical protein